MKNRELFELQKQLDVVKDLEGVKFSFICARNKRAITPIIESLEEVVKPKEGFVEFETKRAELLKKYSRKDENGEPITVKVGEDSVQYEIEDEKALNKAVEKLKKEHSDAVAEREKQIKEYNSLLEEDFDTSQLSMMDVDVLPEGIALNQVIVLRKILEFDGIEGEEIEITRNDLLKLDEAIMPFVENTERDFVIKMAYNYLQSAPFIVETKTHISPSERYTEFSNKFQMTAINYAKKNDKGGLMYNEQTGSLSLDETRIEDMNKELEKLRKEYADAIEDFNSKQTENNEYLKEKIKISLATIDLDELPSNITTEKLEGIDYMVSM